MTNLIELAERVEKATGPDRELDDVIDLALGWRKFDNPTYAGGLIDLWHHPDGTKGRRNEALAGQSAAPQGEVEREDRYAHDDLAKEIYDSWSDQPGWVPWTPYGNSDKQQEARRAAYSAMKGEPHD